MNLTGDITVRIELAPPPQPKPGQEVEDHEHDNDDEEYPPVPIQGAEFGLEEGGKRSRGYLFKYFDSQHRFDIVASVSVDDEDNVVDFRTWVEIIDDDFLVEIIRNDLEVADSGLEDDPKDD